MITLVFGDSIAWGAYDFKQGGWVEKLKRRELKKGNFVYNLSISGNTSSDILKRFENEIKVHLDKNDRLNIIFAFGINDSCRVRAFTHTPVPDYIKNIKNIIKIAKKYTKDIYFVGLTKVDEKRSNPVSWLGYKGEHLHYIDAYVGIYDDYLKKVIVKYKGGKYIRVFHLLTNKDLYDGVHPNAKGHNKLYNKIIKEIDF